MSASYPTNPADPTFAAHNLPVSAPLNDGFSLPGPSRAHNPFLSPQIAPTNLAPTFSHLPTPTSPNNAAVYGNLKRLPESPLSSQAHNPRLMLGQPMQRPFSSASREGISRFEQMATPESSPSRMMPLSRPNSMLANRQLVPLSSLTPRTGTPGAGRGPAKRTDEIPTPLAPAPFIPTLLSEHPIEIPSSQLSSPFMGKVSTPGNQHSLLAHSRASPSPQPRVTLPSIHSGPTAGRDVFSEAPPSRSVSVTSVDLGAPPAILPRELSPAEQDHLRAHLAAEEAVRAQQLEIRRPDYLKRAKRMPEPHFRGVDDDDRILPGLGITVSPMKGRRIKLFQETSDESFEESLFAGGYGKYRTVPDRPTTPEMQQRTRQWLEQGTPNPTSVPAVVVPPVKDKEPDAKQVLKRKRLDAFRNAELVCGSPAKLRAVELAGIGRVVMSTEEQEAAAEETPTGRRKPRRKELPVLRAPGRRKANTAGTERASSEDNVDGPGWLDSEFPWSLRAFERAESERREQAERLRWIERYLERDSEESASDDDNLPIPARSRGRVVPLRVHQASMGLGDVIIPTGAADAKWHLQKIVAENHRGRRSLSPDSTFMERVCICKRVDDGTEELVQCDDCRTWYHPPCVGIRDVSELGGEDDPWFCHRCTLGGAPSPVRTPPPPPMTYAEPAFAQDDTDHASRHFRVDPMLVHPSSFQPSPGIGYWSTLPGAPPTTPSRKAADGSSSSFSSRSSQGDSASRYGPSTPRSAQREAIRVYSTPVAFNDIADEPFDPTSTPSRGLKSSAPFATPRTNMFTGHSGLRSPGKRARANSFGTPLWPGIREDEVAWRVVDDTPVGRANTKQHTPYKGPGLLYPKHPVSPSRVNVPFPIPLRNNTPRRDGENA